METHEGCRKNKRGETKRQETIKKRSNRVVGPLSKHVSEKQTSNDFPRRGVDKELRLFIEAEATEKRATDKRGICVDDQSRA